MLDERWVLVSVNKKGANIIHQVLDPYRRTRVPRPSALIFAFQLIKLIYRYL